MSKAFPPICLLALLALCVVVSTGQDILATIEFDPSGVSVTVQGKYLKSSPNRRNLSFMRSIAGAGNLANRISQLRLHDSNGNDVAFKKLMDGEYLADKEFESWAYRFDLTPPKHKNAAAHVSWFANGTGILMLADALPQLGGGANPKPSARINFVPPRSFENNAPFIRSSEGEEKGAVEVADIGNGVFYIGTGWESGHSLDQPNLVDVYVSGAWNFAAADASAMAREIYEAYERRFGRSVIGRPFIAISKFPEQVGFGEWQAETRGRNITIISSDMPFRTQSLQRLHEQLRHEIFHLWIPNGVNLTGNYDWFYEGFALYQSLKLAVVLNRIRFDDFLDTLSRAHTIDIAFSQRPSLLQASTARFSGSNTQVYARGMLVAFLTDLTLLHQSKGKRSVEDLLKDLYIKHRKPAEPVDGNTAVLGVLRSNSGIAPIVEKYIVGAEKLEWTAELSAAGIEDTDAGPLTRLQAMAKPGGRQKALLDKLGYNNWRNLSPTSK